MNKHIPWAWRVQKLCVLPYLACTQKDHALVTQETNPGWGSASILHTWKFSLRAKNKYVVCLSIQPRFCTPESALSVASILHPWMFEALSVCQYFDFPAVLVQYFVFELPRIYVWLLHKKWNCGSNHYANPRLAGYYAELLHCALFQYIALRTCMYLFLELRTFNLYPFPITYV